MIITTEMEELLLENEILAYVSLPKKEEGSPEFETLSIRVKDKDNGGRALMFHFNVIKSEIEIINPLQDKVNELLAEIAGLKKKIEAYENEQKNLPYIKGAMTQILKDQKRQIIYDQVRGLRDKTGLSFSKIAEILNRGPIKPFSHLAKWNWNAAYGVYFWDPQTLKKPRREK